MKRYIIQQIGNTYEAGYYDASGTWQLARRFNNHESASRYIIDLNAQYQSIMKDYHEKFMDRLTNPPSRMTFEQLRWEKTNSELRAIAKSWGIDVNDIPKKKKNQLAERIYNYFRNNGIQETTPNI